MQIRRYLNVALFVAVGATTVWGVAPVEQTNGRRPLRAVLYPFVPDKIGLFWQIEHSFEDSNQDIDLQIVDLSENYYDETSPKAVTNTDADVIELDSVFIQDFIDRKLIQRIPTSLQVPSGTVLQVAADAVSFAGAWFGVPHWVCTNYLFSRPGDALNSAKTFDDLARAVGATHPTRSGVLVDMKGRSTLGELYLDSLLDRHRTFTSAEPYLSVPQRDTKVVDDLKRLRGLCDSDLCRDSDYHDMSGLYARLFARKQGRALLGYSERLYYVGTEKLTSCRKSECEGIDPSEIVIAPLPLSVNGSQPFAWVDSLTISTNCSGQCLSDAQKFIAHVTSLTEVRKQLTPGWGEAPRYLLPAASALYSDQQLAKVAPLYGQLAPALQNAIAVRKAGLNTSLREIGAYLDKQELPK